MNHLHTTFTHRLDRVVLFTCTHSYVFGDSDSGPFSPLLSFSATAESTLSNELPVYTISDNYSLRLGLHNIFIIQCVAHKRYLLLYVLYFRFRFYFYVRMHRGSKTELLLHNAYDNKGHERETYKRTHFAIIGFHKILNRVLLKRSWV